MADKRMEEQEFATAVGLNPDDLEWIVKDAPPVPGDVRERIRRRVHEQTARPAERAASLAQSAPRRRWTLSRIAAAAAVVVALSGTAVLGSSQARAALLSLFHLVPGLGITEATDESKALAAPLQVASAGTEATILAVVAGPEHTEIRLKVIGLPADQSREWDGSWSGDIAFVRPEFPAELVLPDGNRMAPYVIKNQFKDGTLWATFTFGTLPHGTTSVRLEAPTYRGMDLHVAADIPLTEAEAVVASAVELNGATAEVQGIKVEALQYAQDQDLLRFHIGVSPLDPATTMDPPLRHVPNWVSLTDATGRTYPLSVQESDRLSGRSPSYNVAFEGPLQASVKQVTLTVPELYVQAIGSAKLDLTVGDLPVGSSMPVGQQVTVGEWTVQVESLVRKSETKYMLRVDLGPAQENRYLSHLNIVEGGGRWYSNGVVSADRVQSLALDYGPTDGHLSIELGRPVVTLVGPWVVNVPLQ